ncbi:MAG: undecaprenyldiphospho-muramoylpentapeptide beta-N-acetylglucosaminyltransferase [Clostridia bacterium]|nr:undecaprenyldiphospho-muramoylpentapeptide beta-N-acetylglucosaminyltransferase [Clostridia bacterium]
MRVIISAAGTGGHINPGIAIANKIKEHEPDSEIVFFGTDRGLENDLVPRAGYELKKIEAYGIQPKPSFSNIKNLIKTMHSRKVVKKFIDEFKPDVVIGTGGYICGPVFAAANARHVPSFLHESNAFPGRAVKVFARKAEKVFVGFKEAKDCLSGLNNVVVTGTPTKIKKINLSENQRNSIIEELNINNDLPMVLIFGGSQGAQKINEAVVDIIKNSKNEKYQIVWATGPKQFDIIKKSLSSYGIDIENVKNAKIMPYIYNMEDLINLCDLVVCRSGAMTITEIAIVEKPAIFIPLPSVGANRQEDNARVLEKMGAAKVILNSDINGEILDNYISEMVSDKNNLIAMGKKASSIAMYDVEEKIYNEIKSVINTKRK